MSKNTIIIIIIAAAKNVFIIKEYVNKNFWPRTQIFFLKHCINMSNLQQNETKKLKREK